MIVTIHTYTFYLVLRFFYGAVEIPTMYKMKIIMTRMATPPRADAKYIQRGSFTSVLSKTTGS